MRQFVVTLLAFSLVPFAGPLCWAQPGVLGPNQKVSERRTLILTVRPQIPALAVSAVAFSPDGETLATGYHPIIQRFGRDTEVVLWDLATGKERSAIKVPNGFSTYHLAFSPDGKTLAGTGGRLWDVATGKERVILKHPHGCGPMVFSADGKIVATGTGVDDPKTQKVRGAVKLWDVATGKVLFTLEDEGKQVTAVAFSPDGKTLASVSYDGNRQGGTLKLWDLETATERANLKGHADFVQSVTFSADGKTLASSSSDRTVKLWEVATGRERNTLRHTSDVRSVAFSSDGKILASGSLDGTVRLWEID